MNNFNLKYLIIVIVVSVLMVAGAWLFNVINSNRPSNTQKPNQTIEKQPNKENSQFSGPGGGSGASEGAESLSKPIPIKSK